MSVCVRCGFCACYHTSIKGQLESWFSPSTLGSGAQTPVCSLHTYPLSHLSPTSLAHVHHFYHHTSVIITTEQTSMQMLKVMKQLAGILKLPIKLLYFGSWLLYYSQLSFLGPQEKKKHTCVYVYICMYTRTYAYSTHICEYLHTQTYMSTYTTKMHICNECTHAHK